MSRRPRPWREHCQFLANRFELRIRYRTYRGDVEEFAIILLRDTEIGLIEVCRYDTAHGFAHLDLLTRSGTLRRKVPLKHIATFKQAFTYALDDLQKNCEAYWRIFIAS